MSLDSIIFLNITLKQIVIYLFIINIFGFFIMGWDKLMAKTGFWRTPEKTLFTITFLGGGIGTIAGMYVFRHKTRKLRFTIGFPVILFSEIVVAIYYLFLAI